MKRIIAFVLSAALLFTLAACGKSTGVKAGANAGSDAAASAFAGIKSKSWISGKEKLFDQLTLGDEPDVGAIYADMTYDEQMLYGEYKLDEKDNLDQFVRDASFMELRFFNQASQTNPDTVTVDVTSVPYEVIAGARNIKNRVYRDIYEPLVNKNEVHWAILRFANEEAKYAEVLCTFETSGKTVSYYPVERYEAVRDDDGVCVDCTYTPGTKALRYTFDFMGPYFALVGDTDTAVLCSNSFCSDSATGPSFWAFALPDSPLIADMVKGMSGAMGSGTTKDGEILWNLSMKFDSSGLVTIAWTDSYFGAGPEHTHCKQAAYWVTGVGALKHGQFVFADGDTVYYYTDDYAQHETRQLQGYFGDDEINAITDEQLQKIEEKKSDLFEALTKAFAQEGISVSVNVSLGEIALDNAVLFAGDSSELTSEGKAFLKKFVNVYGSVVFNEENADAIRSIVIEGHTAPLSGSTYESGLPLSQARADNVKAFCISDETDLPDDIADVFKASLQTRGMSNSRPVYDSDGEIDTSACRRVSFVFVIDTQKL